MKTFIVAIPLFDSHLVVRAYQLCDHDSDKMLGLAHNYQELADSLLTRGLNMVEEIGIEPFTGGKLLFADINQYQLIMDIPTNLNIQPFNLACVLPSDLLHNDLIFSKLENLSKYGYKLAMSGLPRPSSFSMANLVDYLLLDYMNPEFDNLLRQSRRISKSTTLIITNIPTMDAFYSVSRIHGALFTGKFFDQPISKGNTFISPLKINALQLLNQVTAIDSDLGLIAETVERDPAICIALLRFINSPVVNVTQRVDSIRNAVAILGQREIKRWVTVAVSLQLAQDRPGELTKLSLVRAKFAENLAHSYGMGSYAPRLFLAGLFSLLDIILDMPMEHAIRQIAVDKLVRLALVDHVGELYEVLQLIYAYEHADWDTVTINMIRNDLNAREITQAFIEALVWYKQLLEEIDTI